MTFILAAIIAMYCIFVIIDAIAPARELTPSPAWRLRGAVAFAAYFAVAMIAPLLWDGVLARHTVFDTSRLPVVVQVAIGFATLQLGVYAWHRTMHAVPSLWRAFHQMHHSAERVDIWGAFWFHPLDAAGFAFVASLALVGFVGLDVEAAVAVNLVGAFCSMFQHANLRTPRWLGYIVTRPESHALHHERGAHRYNYGDVPWFDMMFGTFRNPAAVPARVGFYDGASLRLGELLTCQDIERPTLFPVRTCVFPSTAA